MLLASVLAAAAISSCSAFSVCSSTSLVRDVSCQLHLAADGHDADVAPTHLSRRSALSIITLLPLGIVTSSSTPLPANAADKGKVVVFGGAGWVGAHVASNLQKQGYQAVSISRSTPEVQAERTKSILGSTIPGVEYISLDAGSASIDDLAASMKDAKAVISCIGIAPGSPNIKEGNGLVNSKVAKAAQSAGVPKFVYIGVASSLANGPAKFLLGD